MEKWLDVMQPGSDRVNGSDPAVLNTLQLYLWCWLTALTVIKGALCSLKKKFYLYNFNELMIQTQKY